MLTDMLSPWAILTATAGLLAFLLSLYTLVGRDRKSPYLINSVFLVLMICLLAATLAVLGAVFKPWRAELTLVGASTLALAFAITLWRVWTIYMRLALFVDPGGFARAKFLPGVRHIAAALKNWRRFKGPSYEYQAIPITEDVQRSISRELERFKDAKAGRLTRNDGDGINSLALALRRQGQANELLGRLAAIFLSEDGYSVQYVVASRHPIEFVTFLKNNWPRLAGNVGSGSSRSVLDWAQASRGLVVVDGYTPHFGFIDSINRSVTRGLEQELGARLLRSKETFAGLHSASSQAFKAIKKGASKSARLPTLVIYEDMFALADLESVDQYRVFVRHVMPSERLWGGMFTVFAETAQPQPEWRLVSSYASMSLSLTTNDGEEVQAGLLDTLPDEPAQALTAPNKTDVIEEKRGAGVAGK